MIRILQAVNIMDRAGLETMLMNYYRNVDRKLVQFDFLTHRSESGAYDQEILNLGGRVYHAPRLMPNEYAKYFNYMKNFFLEHTEYQVVHSHIDAMSYFPLRAAQKSGIPVRIAHSHSSKLERDLKFPIKYWAKKKVPSVSNIHFACGKLAGEFMYPKGDFQVIHNGIDIEKFAFSEIKRRQTRKELGIQGQFVIGHVGRFCAIKNQIFLLEIFRKVVDKCPDSVLLLIGKGPDEAKIHHKIRELKLDEKVRILIDREDVDRFYSCMDLFVMPSLFEGLPLVAVEAQANGLPCLMSDTISLEVKITNSVEFMPIKDDADIWANRILNMDKSRNDNALLELKSSGYDIKTEAQKLQEWYISIQEKSR